MTDLSKVRSEDTGLFDPIPTDRMVTINADRVGEVMDHLLVIGILAWNGDVGTELRKD